MLTGTPTSPWQRSLMGWFGIRGVGSVYYLGYALTHGIEGPAAATAAGLTISVVAIGIVVHGALAQPVLARYERAIAGDSPPASRLPLPGRSQTPRA
jgi:NhaP-type Na+/H+ or K+/H+ antiporter